MTNAFRSQTLLLLVMVLVHMSALLFGGTAHAQNYPDRPVTIQGGYGPGGLGDNAARRMAQRLSEIWNVPVVVEPKPGAAGMLAAGSVIKAPADGYNLLYVIPETLSVTKALKRPTPGFDPIADLQPVSLVALSSSLLVVPTNSPHKSFKELIAYVQKNPDRLTFGVQGIGSVFHLSLEQLKAAAGADISLIPYKGVGQAVTDLLAERLDGMILSSAVALPHVQARKLRVLAVASEGRIPQMPEIPTIAESGFPGFAVPVGLSVMVRAGTPKHIVDKLSTDIRKVMAEPAMVDWLSSVSAVGTTLTPEEFRQRMRREIVQFQATIDRVGAQKFAE